MIVCTDRAVRIVRQILLAGTSNGWPTGRSMRGETKPPAVVRYSVPRHAGRDLLVGVFYTIVDAIETVCTNAEFH